MNNKRISFTRLNCDTLPNQRVVLDPVRQRVKIGSGKSQICISNVSVAYFRRPLLSLQQYHFGKFHDYVWTEWTAFLRTLYAIVGDRWFNHPNDILLAEDKSRQLKLAHDIGFNVPETFITNDPTMIKDLQSDIALVAKPMKQALIESDDTTSTIFTSQIDELVDDDFASVPLCPVIFQRLIPKRDDIRVTVVGSQVFAVAIHSQAFEETKVDWRRGSNPNLCHEIIDLPEQIAQRCIRIVQAQQLKFGAIDLVRDRHDEFWFLECNPNGQWAWIENRTGLPIAAAIATEMLHVATLR
ncbi:MAG: hypothetical protein OXL96_08190 [Candidatus Poribacteria bacterium]|nr:hypothetical protein [Candidatus Poribacteria bacterium]